MVPAVFGKLFAGCGEMVGGLADGEGGGGREAEGFDGVEVFRGEALRGHAAAEGGFGCREIMLNGGEGLAALAVGSQFCVERLDFRGVGEQVWFCRAVGEGGFQISGALFLLGGEAGGLLFRSAG